MPVLANISDSFKQVLAADSVITTNLPGLVWTSRVPLQNPDQVKDPTTKVLKPFAVISDEGFNQHPGGYQLDDFEVGFVTIYFYQAITATVADPTAKAYILAAMNRARTLLHAEAIPECSTARIHTCINIVDITTGNERGLDNANRVYSRYQLEVTRKAG